MALTHFAFGSVNSNSGANLVPAMVSPPTSEAVTPSASNQQTTATCPKGARVCRVATDTAVYVAFGASPDATTSDSRFFMPAGTIEYFVVSGGDKGAVVTIS